VLDATDDRRLITPTLMRRGRGWFRTAKAHRALTTNLTTTATDDKPC
jgi:hypothetical protein